MANSFLLKNATLLTHDKDEKVVALRNHDLLVEDGLIAKLGENIETPAKARVIDCTEKIVCPGFISTHSHLWQTRLKGRFSDSTLFSYLPQHFTSFVFSPEDIYLGQLAGCLEFLDGGCTTTLDHSQGSHTIEHATRCLDATVDSGMRAVWAYAEPPRLSHWDMDSCAPSYDYWNAEMVQFLATAAQHHNRKDSRVEIGVGFDSWFLPKEMTTPILRRLNAAGVSTLTCHIGSDAVQGLAGQPLTNIQNNHEFLQGDHLGMKNFVASHCMGVKDTQLELIRELRKSGLNVNISTTLTKEAAMCMHQTPAFNPLFSEQADRSVCSLGVDCHCSGMSYLPAIGALLTEMVRINSNEKYLANDKYPLKMRSNNNAIFKMMTVYGARALGMDNDNGGIGKLAVGRKADLVVIDTVRPGIGAAALHDPLDALLGFSNSGDVEYVFVDGVAVKENFKLLPVKTKQGSLEWKDLRGKLLQSYQEVQPRIDRLNIQKGTEAMAGLFRIDMSRFVAGE